MTGYEVIQPDKQIAFSHKLGELRPDILREGLQAAVSNSDIETINKELAMYAGKDKVGYVAKFGIRGEVIFPVPTILEAQPSVLGYYRLMLGLSKKKFYSQGPFGKFRAMEESNKLGEKRRCELPDLCICLTKGAWALIQDIEETSEQHIDELILLTLGAQFSGSHRAKKGATKARIIYNRIKEIVRENITEENKDQKKLTIQNDSGREILINFSNDPDVRIREKLSEEEFRNILAIEIKGGTDRSNIYNRLGEAEKSHAKAKQKGYVCWTIIGVDVPKKVVEQATPTTRRAYFMDNLRNKSSDNYKDFREHLTGMIGIRK